MLCILLKESCEEKHSCLADVSQEKLTVLQSNRIQVKNNEIYF